MMVPEFRFDVLGLGAVAVDDLLYIEEYPAADSKVGVRHRERQCGGLTGTALVAAARLGARCAYAGVLGHDELSQIVAACFEREGINLGPCVRRQDASPAHSTVIVDETRKTRTIFASLDGVIGADAKLPPGDIIRSASVLLVDHHGLEGTLRAARIAGQSGIGVVADLERDPGPPFSDVLAEVDHLIVSERFAGEVTGADDAATAARRLWNPHRETVVLTCGARGCWYLDRSAPDRPNHFPAFAVEVVDTTGCGDVFHGAYAAALAEGRDVAGRIALASATAALKATRRGGQAGIPHRDAVETFLARRR
jgi:sugar/nucleoside kinase (ribokinase family)